MPTPRMKKPPHLTQAETGRVLAYCEVLLGHLNLTQHQVMLLFEATPEPEEGEAAAWASMDWTDQKRVGNLRLCKDWELLPDDVKQECLVHELLHLLLREVDDCLDVVWASPYFPILMSGQWHERYTLATEQAVHHLTRLLLPNVPPYPDNGLITSDRVYLQRVHD